MAEWDNEPDRKHWVDPETGLNCLIVRNGLGGKGALCGYVGVPEGHPWHGKEYEVLETVEIHGGLTYARGCGANPHVCHSAEKGDAVAHDHVWWLGFDCAHLGDYIPGMDCESRSQSSAFREGRSTYKNIAYVENECRRLAAQVKAAQ